MNTFVVALVIAVVGTEAASLNGQSGCLYDGKIYAKGAEIRIGNCLGAMTCDGDNSYSNLVQWGGICPEKDSKRENKNGCWFDGKEYAKGEQIVFGNCLGAMTCDGDNSYSNLVQWGNVCPNKDSKRESMGMFVPATNNEDQRDH
ncbi:uncharacterized protein LOC106175667 [Lingula anatina]|uniref:Uncharacterized protein LOC106175667 n=1 Tax=Lingula anatina TaxID=7574 RepID=A0A1S3JS61_LINAN|nr:uncharacterized protein LOC106175667 [Lingula anatina]|eukprot:XP_013413223.1 uncharacterized protein LOC106175667 [Lingula anatina]